MGRREAEFTYSFRSLPADSRQLHLTFAVYRGVPLAFRLDPSRPLTSAVFGLGK